MARTKATVRRLPRPTFIPAPGQRIGNENILNRRLRNAPFKIKKLMSETKQVEGKKNWPSREKNERKAKNYLLYRNTKVPILIKN